MTNIVINPSQTGTGQFSIDAPVSNNNRSFTLPDNNGTVVTTGSTAAVSQAMLAPNTVGNGPAFSAFQSTAQSLTANTITKLQFQTEEFDTNNNYDTTTFRFTPTVAGYYQVSGGFRIAATQTALQLYIYKNGGQFKEIGTQTSTNACVFGSAILLLNGTTDFIEFFGLSAVTQNTSASSIQTYFQAYLARAM